MRIRRNSVSRKKTKEKSIEYFDLSKIAECGAGISTGNAEHWTNNGDSELGTSSICSEDWKLELMYQPL